MSALQKLLIEAAEIISDEAESLRQSCEGNKADWACRTCKRPCPAERDHKRMMKCVRRLLKSAEQP